MVNNEKKTIFVLGLIIFILLVILLYSFVFNPMVNSYVYEKQVEAQDLLISGIVFQISQFGYAALPYENETLFLVSVDEPTSENLSE